RSSGNRCSRSSSMIEWPLLTARWCQRGEAPCKNIDRQQARPRSEAFAGRKALVPRCVTRKFPLLAEFPHRLGTLLFHECCPQGPLCLRYQELWLPGVPELFSHCSSLLCIRIISRRGAMLLVSFHAPSMPPLWLRAVGRWLLRWFR